MLYANRGRGTFRGTYSLDKKGRGLSKNLKIKVFNTLWV
jgi:hypothetical protein